MATDYTRQWIKFFTECGIPEDIAATYGLIFNENRIQKNMLLDLNKEYLRDMGITVMGDVIAILRHARIVHDKHVREQVLSESGDQLDSDSYPLVEDSPSRKSTPVKRMLEHYTRRMESSDLTAPQETVEICIENEKSVPKLAHRVGMATGIRQKIEAPTLRSDDSVPGKLEVPVAKSRRVLPENEGRYKIKMPSGTTERSKKILQKVKIKQSKTVFDRLGESSVSSTSDVDTATLSQSKISINKDKNSSSVFSRLGEKSPLVTSTSSNGETLKDQLPYIGVFKPSPTRKRLPHSPNSTMRADSESKAADPKLKKIDSLRERLGKNADLASGASSNLNRIKITINHEGDRERIKVNSLPKGFRSIQGESLREKKNVLDGVGTFRSETIQSKPKVTSTTKSPDMKQRPCKRKLEDSESSPVEVPEVSQAKKVRFGRTTQRLIPANKVPATRISAVESVETKSFTLSSGIRIGRMNSDGRQKPSMRDRIGGKGIPQRWGRAAMEMRRKRSLKFFSSAKRGQTSVHDRLG